MKHEQIAGVHNTKQQAFKILINSAYGGVGNSYFLYYSVENAEAITVTGRVGIKWIEKKVNDKINRILKNEEYKDYIIAIDTDSIYVNLYDIVKAVFGEYTADNPNSINNKEEVVDFIDKFCRDKINPYIEKCYEELSDYLNSYENHMDMKREIISDNAIWTGKKRYMMQVMYDEDKKIVDKPKKKVMGIETVKSSTPYVCREKLKEVINLALTKENDALIEYIDDFKEHFDELSVEEIAFPRGVTEIHKWVESDGKTVKSGCPINVRASIVYNNMIDFHNLGKKYKKIGEGDQMRFVYLKTPNPAHSNVIGFPEVLPKELDLHSYIDYNLQFKKVFLAPIESITEVIGWDTEKKFKLEDFFV